MARITPRNLRKAIETIIEEENGTVKRVITYEQIEGVDDQGSMNDVTRARNIITVNGKVWNPSFANGPKPDRLAKCGVCKRLMTVEAGEYCAACGRMCCPLDRRIGSDRRPRCRSCAFRHSVRRMLSSIFFVTED